MLVVAAISGLSFGLGALVSYVLIRQELEAAEGSAFFWQTMYEACSTSRDHWRNNCVRQSFRRNNQSFNHPNPTREADNG